MPLYHPESVDSSSLGSRLLFLVEGMVPYSPFLNCLAYTTFLSNIRNLMVTIVPPIIGDFYLYLAASCPSVSLTLFLPSPFFLSSVNFL
ncbi:hypothetical protein F4809DRAFT_600457 [Biscogniauxia mediterranea]|nr:hypothetical protein F4809DRAFT_600457 [Biscogniauxia mediterranea]